MIETELKTKWPTPEQRKIMKKMQADLDDDNNNNNRRDKGVLKTDVTS